MLSANLVIYFYCYCTAASHFIHYENYRSTLHVLNCYAVFYRHGCEPLHVDIVEQITQQLVEV